ncbi:P-loop containing nucleoside triphosphate hydrolase [Phytophthora cactorum]|nr:P-loop containing nucleoside triphosphate hydrolase [Phytophthora cactorum]
MVLVALGKGTLHRVAAACNIRSILFHLAPTTAKRTFLREPGVGNAVRALETHGYRLGFIGDSGAKDSSVMSAFHIVHGDKKNGVSVYELASKELKVPLNRTLLVTEATLSEGSANGAISVALPTQSEDTEAQPFLARLATDLLNFDQCLDPAGRCFGPFRVLFSQVFYESALSFALVNLKPIVPGHVLVVPKRPVARFEMLDVDEVSDLWTAAQLVGKQVEQYYGASSLTFAIQDGKEAGQTVKHVHIHVIPRIAQDFERNDDIYTEVSLQHFTTRELFMHLTCFLSAQIEKHGHALHVDNETRTARSKADMAAEAAQLRPLFCSEGPIMYKYDHPHLLSIRSESFSDLRPDHGMTITPDEAWGLACRRCDALVARHSQLSFVLENMTGVHLTLDKTLLRYEQLGESWRVSSHSGVLPELQFTKIRTKNAFKRQRLPFELCCGHCDAKVASEGFLDELPDESMLLLDSKACSCVLDRKFPYGVAGLPLKILKVQELVDVERVQNVPETEVLPVVHPTVTTIRGHFSPKAKMSKLRRYQVELTLSALLENTIVYLPTGCGKTLVAIKVLDEMKYLNPNKLVVFFVPTGLDGDVDALVVTPQYFLNLLFNDRTKITDYSVMVFDEAHHATGNHPYCELLKRLATVDLQTRPHILALTASPFGEGVREMSGQTALNNLAQAFNAVVNAPTIAAEDLEASFIPKEAQWVTVEESEHERKLREGIKRYIESFYTQIRRLMNGQVMTFETNYDTDDMELSQFLAKLRILRLQAEKMARGPMPLRRLESNKVASSFYNLSIHGAGTVAEALRRIFSELEYAESRKGKRTFVLIEPAYRAIMSPALINFPLETFTGTDISNRVHLVAECIRRAHFDHNSRAIVFVRRRKRRFCWQKRWKRWTCCASSTPHVLLDTILTRAILDRVSELASVRRVDEAIGLCTVAASPDQSIYSSYNSLCSGVEFFIQEQTFWMRFESDDMERAAGGEVAENIPNVGLRRGLMTPDGAFMELENFGNADRSPGDIEMAADALIADFGYRRVEFDLRALNEPLVWFDLTPSAGSAASVYLSFRLPPSCYIEDEREFNDPRMESSCVFLETWDRSPRDEDIEDRREKYAPTKLRFALPVASIFGLSTRRTLDAGGIMHQSVLEPGVNRLQSHRDAFKDCVLSTGSSARNRVFRHWGRRTSFRSWIGDLSQLTSPAKYLKRLGQAFSSTKETFEVNQSVLDNPVEDIENDQYVFTDGCGEIALVGAESIVKELQLLYTPSAFQIRLGGAKGVLVVSDLGNPKPSREDAIVLRKSMSKFTSKHTMLEIVACAGKSEAYLTRQSVLILNDLGIDEDVFMEMQEEFLSDLRSLIASDDGAYFELTAVLPPSVIWWIDVLVRKLEVKILVDEYLSSLARTIYHYRLANTVMRARIPIAKGRTLMGVADFTGTLEYGEVFVQYSETDEEFGTDSYVVLDDVDVAVHRSPCHHPGDIRVLRCRAEVPPQLRQLKDCIVFPSKGPRPHPDECTGGDLDGDMFVVIWDKRLIPSRTQVHEPMVFDEDTGGDTSPRGDEYHQSTDDAGLVDFYIHSIQDDILGIASNAHLALCDSSNDGSLDENAKILARICSKQVDSLRAEKDLEIVRNLAPKSYPDFMQKKDKPSYPSKKILGNMYRRCKAIYDTTMTKGMSQMPIRDDHFLISGYTDYVEQAQLLYRQYKLRLRALLLMSGAQTEAELATGMIVEPQSEYKTDYFRFGEQCKDAFYALQTAFRSQFDSDTSSLALGEKLKVAAACYFVTHDDSDATTRCLSFPWIVIDLLTTIKTNNAGRTHYKLWTPVRLSAYAQTIPKLQLCMLAEIVTNTEELLADLFDRLVAVTSLRSEMPGNLHKKEFDLILFGSSELLTFEKQSDLDVMVRCSSSRGSLEAIARALERSHGNIDLKEGIRVPLLSFSFQQWSVEMCKFSAGPVKTRLFRSYMERHNFFWPCVYFLVRWGKCVGLIRRLSGGGLDMFSPTGFIWLFIRFCTEKNFVQPISAGTITMKEILKDNDIDSEISFWTTLLTRVVSGNEDASGLSAADVLLSFFAHYAKLSTPFSDYGFTDPLDPENDTQLEPEAVTLFRSECHIALHQLAIAQGDIKYLLTHREEQTSRITLSHALSTRIHEAKDFFSRKILFNAKAEGSTRLLFKLHPNLLRSDLYVAEIVGPGDAVQRIEDHIRMIEQELGARMPFRSNRNFHHEGSSLLLFEGAESQQEKIGFQDYFGERHGEHNNIRLHQAHLICFMNGRQWYEHAGATFCAKFIQQMIKLSRYEHLNPGVARAKAFVRFGHHYLINLPRSFDEETIMLASIKKLEDEFERGRTARELYESVLIAKQKQRAQAEIAEDNQKDMLPDAGNQSGEGVWGEYSDEEQEGWGGENDYMEEGGIGYGGGGGGGARQKRRPRPPRMKLQKAATITRGDKGATHSFYSMIERHHAPWTKEYAEKRLGMTLVEESDSYQVSIVHQSFEYNVRLTDDLQLVKISTRPSRWFSATLKMRQEMDDESHMMDSTPDVRFYVSTTENMPKTDSLYVKLAECCKNAPDGRGIIEFCEETRDKVRISRHLVDAGESPACIGTVRHVRGAKYSNSQTETHLSLMHIREFSIPDRNPEDGFMSVRDKVEAEFSLPTLTPERRLLPAFAREFLATGMEFVDFLRTQADMDMP